MMANLSFLFVYIAFFIKRYYAETFTLEPNLEYGSQVYGQMFDIVCIKSPIIIKRFDLHMTLDGGVTSIEIYTKQGSYTGYENNSSEWERIYSDSIRVITSNDWTILSDFLNPITVLAQQTQAFYIHLIGTSQLEYSNISITSGNEVISDDNIQLLSGIGFYTTFDAIFGYNSPWNGRIHYINACDQFQMISETGQYMLSAYQTKDPADTYTICYQISHNYTCWDPYINITTNAIDYDQYGNNNEYLTIKYFKDDSIQENTDCYDESLHPCLCCGASINCVSNYTGDIIFNSNTLYKWVLQNGPGVHAYCNPARTMDADIILTCNNEPTSSPTAIPTKSPTALIETCYDYITIEGDGEYSLNAYATELLAERVVCWDIIDGYTCYNPVINIKTKSIDYDQVTDEYLHIRYGVDDNYAIDFGECRGGSYDRCDIIIDCVNYTAPEPLQSGHLYQIKLNIGEDVHGYCDPKRTMDADVTITCSPTINPTTNPTIYPTITPTILTRMPSETPSVIPTESTNIPSAIPTESPTVCDETIHIDGDNTYSTHISSDASLIDHLLCFEINTEYTCYYPFVNISYVNTNNDIAIAYIKNSQTHNIILCNKHNNEICTKNTCFSQYINPNILQPHETYQLLIQQNTNNNSFICDDQTISLTIELTCYSSESPTKSPSMSPSISPTTTPTNTPTEGTQTPSNTPTLSPSEIPTVFPSESPTIFPTESPSNTPSTGPTVRPSAFNQASKSVLSEIFSNKQTLVPILSIGSLLVCVIACFCVAIAYKMGQKMSSRPADIEMTMKQSFSPNAVEKEFGDKITPLPSFISAGKFRAKSHSISSIASGTVTPGILL